MLDLINPVIDFFNQTQIPVQLREVDLQGLFFNPWFMVPVSVLILWWLYTQAISKLAVTALAFGLWLFSGSSYSKNLIINNELQLDKVWPLTMVGVIAIAIIIYLVFVRDD